MTEVSEAIERIRARQCEGYFTHPDIATVTKAAEECEVLRNENKALRNRIEEMERAIDQF